MTRRIAKTSSEPLYRQIIGLFQGRILEGELPEGARLPSIRELERTLGVSPETVKRAFADLAAMGLVQKAHGKGVFVCRRAPASPFWGVVIPFYTDYYNQMITRLRREAEPLGISIAHACDYDEAAKESALVEDFLARGAAGVIVAPTRDERAVLPRYQRLARRTPIALFDRTTIASQLPYVIQDYVHGARLALLALMSGGASRLVFVRDPLWTPGSPIAQTLENEYFSVCEEMPGAYARVIDAPDDLTAAEYGAPDFDGVFCVNDQIACLVAGRLAEAGVSVPERVQLVGYNNTDIGRYFSPAITTICPDLPWMCRRVSEILRSGQAGAPAESRQYVRLPTLLRRQSTRLPTRELPPRIASGLSPRYKYFSI